MDEPRMTLQTLAVLKVLLDDPLVRRYGLDISKKANLPTGSIYPILARLERAGWLESAWEEVDPSAARRPRRRFYSLTRAGAEVAAAASSKAQEQIAPSPTRNYRWRRQREAPA